MKRCSLAPGHLLTPRSGSTDILARGMHNIHNRIGAPVFFNGVEPLVSLENRLKIMLSQGLLDRFTVSLRNPEFAVAQVWGDSDQEAGWRAEVGLPFGGPSDRDIRRRDEKDELVSCEEDQDACRFSPLKGGSTLGIPLTWSLQGEEWSNYEALGFMVRSWRPVRMGRIGWDFLWGLEIGQKWYFSEARDTSRFVWGSHAAFGLGVLFIDLGFQRGNRLFEDGGQSRNSFYSAGIRFQIP